MDTPTPESSASTTSTLAPAEMADWASVSWVASLPWAFWMVNCDELIPALVKAFFR